MILKEVLDGIECFLGRTLPGVFERIYEGGFREVRVEFGSRRSLAISCLGVRWPLECGGLSALY